MYVFTTICRYNRLSFQYLTTLTMFLHQSSIICFVFKTHMNITIHNHISKLIHTYACTTAQNSHVHKYNLYQVCMPQKCMAHLPNTLFILHTHTHIHTRLIQTHVYMCTRLLHICEIKVTSKANTYDEHYIYIFMCVFRDMCKCLYIFYI